jgi:hypothetical protein
MKLPLYAVFMYELVIFACPVTLFCASVSKDASRKKGTSKASWQLQERLQGYLQWATTMCDNGSPEKKGKECCKLSGSCTGADRIMA